jgi:hypothetical protein
MAYAPYEQLLNMTNLTSTLIEPYDIALGGSGLIFIIFYFAIIVLIALSTESPAGTAVFSLLGAIIFYLLIPVSAHPFFYGIALFSLAITLYKLFVHKRGAAI